MAVQEKKFIVLYKFSLGNTFERLEIDREYLQVCELKVYIAYSRIRAGKSGSSLSCDVYRQYKLEDVSGIVYDNEDILERSRDAFKRFVVVHQAQMGTANYLAEKLVRSLYPQMRKSYMEYMSP